MVYNSVMLAIERKNQERCEFVTRSEDMERVFSKIKRKKGMKKAGGQWERRAENMRTR